MQKQYKQAKNKVQNVSCAKLYYLSLILRSHVLRFCLSYFSNIDSIKRICSSHFPVSRTLTSSKWKLHSWSLDDAT